MITNLFSTVTRSTLIILLSSLFCATAYAETKIGIVVPMQHQALDEIVAGFKDVLQKQYNKPVSFKVANAQNDPNLQHAIIQQMRDSNYDLIVTVATQPSEMAANIIKNKPIIALAADISDAQRKKLTPCNIAVVDDEVGASSILNFIHEAYPGMQNMILIHSAAEKILPEVAEAKNAAKQAGINLKDITIQNLMDLQSVARTLPSNTQGIFVLKDNLVVSGISQLAQIAKIKHIPLITSDDGSVKKGAGFAVGVRESQIGINGAELALQILQGKNACSLPINKMDKLFVFINSEALKQSQQSETAIVNTASKLHYSIVHMNSET